MRGYGEAEVREIVKKVINENLEVIERKGDYAAKALMGMVMKEARGRADGKLVNRVLEEELNNVYKEGTRK